MTPETGVCSGRVAIQTAHCGRVVVGAEEARDGRNGNRKTHDVILKEKVPWGKQAGRPGQGNRILITEELDEVIIVPGGCQSFYFDAAFDRPILFEQI